MKMDLFEKKRLAEKDNVELTFWIHYTMLKMRNISTSTEEIPKHPLLVPTAQKYSNTRSQKDKLKTKRLKKKKRKTYI